jgi:hypothetical protein
MINFKLYVYNLRGHGLQSKEKNTTMRETFMYVSIISWLEYQLGSCIRLTSGGSQCVICYIDQGILKGEVSLYC